jgi:hypothetical protein
MIRLLQAGLFLGTAFGGETPTATEWAKQSQNPMAGLFRLPLENRFEPDTGHKDRTAYTLNLQPAMPSALNDDWILINRLDIPFSYRPGLEPGDRDAHGLGDIVYESFYGPSCPGSFIWGAGPLLSVPTATDSKLGSKKWSAGIGGTGLTVLDRWVMGARINNLWSFAGADDRPEVNLMTLEYFIHYHLDDGWYVSTAPINTANWEASGSEVWTIPVGGGIGKVVRPTQRPVRFELQAYYNLEAPDASADWSIIFEIQFLFTQEAFFKTP